MPQTELNLDAGVNGSHDGVTLFEKKGSFIITDDLKITPFLVDKSFEYLSTLGVECINSLYVKLLSTLALKR